MRNTVRAGFWIRTLACIVDVMIVLAASAPVELVIYRLGRNLPIEDLSDDMFTFYLIVSAFYHVLFVWKKGATPGKALFGLRVVTVDSDSENQENQKTLRFWRAFARWLGYGASCFIFGAGFLMAAFHPQKRAMHDLLAGSRVIRNR